MGENKGVLRILLIDDDLDMRVVISALIKQLWKCVELEVAAGGREALQKLDGHDFDVVLTDIQMPEMDGYATAAAIRQLPPPHCNINIICMTGGKLSVEKLQEAGIDGYLLKPFSLEDLRFKLSEIRAAPLYLRDDG